MKYIPSWLPGAEFQRIAARTRWISDEIKDVSMKEIRQAMVCTVEFTGEEEC